MRKTIPKLQKFAKEKTKQNGKGKGGRNYPQKTLQ
jgi:hypothetical protein